MAFPPTQWCACVLLMLAASDGVQGSPADDFESTQKNSLIRLPSNYTRSLPPISANSSLKIYIDLGLWAIRDISASNMEMEVDLLIYVSWRDYRVEVNQSMANKTRGRILVGDDGPKLWLPVIAFKNCKGCSPLNLNPNVFLIHYHTKYNAFWTVIRTVQRLSCNIDLSAFPMDRQNCKIQLENCYEDTSKVEFKHHHSGPYSFRSDLELSEFKVLDIVPGDCSAKYGNKWYSCLEVEVRLARVLGYHFTTTFAPTLLIVMLSWISFWLPVKLAPARITLGVTSLLTLATRLDQSQKNLPAVSYIKAIDIWMFTCIFLVFASLIEFAFSFYASNLTKNTDATTEPCKRIVQIHSITPVNCSSRNQYTSISKLEEATMLDRRSKIVFPGVFLLFNICYWAKYLLHYYDD